MRHALLALEGRFQFGQQLALALSKIDRSFQHNPAHQIALRVTPWARLTFTRQRDAVAIAHSDRNLQLQGFSLFYVASTVTRFAGINDTTTTSVIDRQACCTAKMPCSTRT